MSLRAVLFDFDGLLVDTETVWYQEWHAVFARFDLDLTPEIWARVVGTVSIDPHAELEREVGRSIDRAIGRAADAAAEAACRGLDLREGARDLLAAVDAAGVRRAIVSSSPTWWPQEHMARLNCDSWECIVSADGNPARSKPAPVLYLEALEIMGLDPAEVLVLEDSTNGIRAAKGAGLRVIAVPNGVTRFFDLSEADDVVDSLHDVIPALRG